MRKITNLNRNWNFSDIDGQNVQVVDLPHTWNAHDGNTGGNAYLRAKHLYAKHIARPDGNVVYLEIKGANSTATVYVNGKQAVTHHGGFATFRADITKLLADGDNLLVVEVDNQANECVYPQTADFTFFGGIYRDVNIVTMSANHFALDFCGKQGLKVTPRLVDGKWTVTFATQTVGKGDVVYQVYDGETLVCTAADGSDTVQIDNPHLWDGLADPHMYTAVAKLYVDGEIADEISDEFGLRTFSVDADKGFMLNGRSYPLRGVCRHQDREGMGYAITRAEHDEDMALIKQVGANTIRLAHYQHDDYFYDLCDKEGMVVWAEIPYISRHMPDANDNTETQITELITQQYNHPSIVVWGVSNEITMFGKHRKDMLAQHVKLNDLCHEMDDTRLTTLACFSMCTPWNKVAHITDIVSWNLYLGWYMPGLWLNDAWFWLFRKLYPRRPIGLSEYGAEGMPNLHSTRPRRGDNTEEYQCVYHEYMLKFFERAPYLWATHVWNMFDFAADARDQGGEPGMNHKGLVTYDRKTKKDVYYLYQAYWTTAPMLHICGKRFVNRNGNKLTVKVYSNLSEVSLYRNGQLVQTQQGNKVFVFTMSNDGTSEIEVRAGELTDKTTFVKVAKPDPTYKLKKTNTKNWQEK